MKNAGHPDLIGVPSCYSLGVNSMGGGDVVADIVVPTGQIWIVKYLVAYHNDAGGNRTLVWMFKDPINATNIQGPYQATAANIRYPFPFATSVPGPLVLSPGGFNMGVICQAMAAAQIATIECHYHRILGVSPLV